MTSFNTLAEDFRRGELHHAYLIEGERDGSLVALRAWIETDLLMPIAGNPDVWSSVGETFGIDEARELRHRQEQSAFNSGRKIFIVAAHVMTSEAQNALLKVSEEPTAGTHLFFIVPYREGILPTLRSRMVMVSFAIKDAAQNADVTTFLKARSIAERLKVVKPLIDEKDKAAAAAFVDALIARLRGTGGTLAAPGVASTLTDLLCCRGYLASRSPSVKMILEHAVGIIPDMQT